MSWLWPPRRGSIPGWGPRRKAGSLRLYRAEGLKDEAGIAEGAGEGSPGEGEANEVGILSEFAPGELWQRRARAPQNCGASFNYLGDGRGSLFLAPSWGPPGAVGLGDRGRGQAPLPRASAPPEPRHRGPERRFMESAFAGIAGSSVTCYRPRQRSVWVGPRSRASEPRSPDQGTPGRTPHPGTPTHLDGDLGRRG